MTKEDYEGLTSYCSWKDADWNNKEILITGGTGSLGRKLTEILLKRYHPKGIRIFSRDEVKQASMEAEFSKKYKGNVGYHLGNVRDYERVKMVSRGVDLVIHAAAMKRIEKCEADPIEAIETNINGSINILRASIENGVEKVMGVSTDKAVYNVNLYGATKLCAEKLLIAGNVYSQGEARIPKISCCRYGNVSGSTGSVIPLFRKQKVDGLLTITSAYMSRFWITLDEAAQFILNSISHMIGEEIFIPKMDGYRIFDLAKAIAPKAEIRIVGPRDGEKTHETILTVEESHHIIETNVCYIVRKEFQSIPFNKQVASTNVRQLSVEELQEKLKWI